jgi:peroxiredoxin
MKPEWSSRTSYVISPSGQIVHAYTDMKANEHVNETMAAVKTWKASHKK